MYLGRGFPGTAEGWDSYPNDEGYGVWAKNGSFRWYEGYMGVFKGAAFRIDSADVDGLVIMGGNFESGARLLDVSAATSQPFHILVEGNRYSAAYTNASGASTEADSLVIRSANSGVYLIRSNRWGQGTQSGQVKFAFTHNGASYVEIVGNAWDAAGMDQTASVSVMSATELEMHGNTYKDAAGTRILRRERRLEGVQAIEWDKAGGIRGNNLRGSVTISGSATTGEVLFTTLGGNEYDQNYFLATSGAYNVKGTPPDSATRIKKVTKGNTKVILEVEEPPGAGNSVTFDWIMVR